MNTAARFIPATLKARLRRQAWYATLPLAAAVTRRRPASPRGRVIFAGLGRHRLADQGKLSARAYLPALCDALREAGYDTRFVVSLDALERAMDGPAPVAVVMIYNEEWHIPSGPRLDAALARADLVFHHPDTGRIVADKRRTNAVLSAAGVPMPRMVTRVEGRVFSNDVSASAAAVSVLEEGAALDAARYNTEFIDTRVEHGGKDYYSTVRVMCIGPSITHALVRARDAAQNSAGVHSRDTPADAPLINALYRRLVEPNRAELKAIARRIHGALGPGFYAHDVLVERGTDRILVCETGFKFDNAQYARLVGSIQHLLPAWAPFHSPAEAARNSAVYLIDLLDERLSAKSA